MIVENILQSISTKVWGSAGIKLITPGSAIGLATDCVTGPCQKTCLNDSKNMHCYYVESLIKCTCEAVIFVQICKSDD